MSRWMNEIVCTGVAQRGMPSGACDGTPSSTAWSDTTVPTPWTALMLPATSVLFRYILPCHTSN